MKFYISNDLAELQEINRRDLPKRVADGTGSWFPIWVHPTGGQYAFEIPDEYVPRLGNILTKEEFKRICGKLRTLEQMAADGWLDVQEIEKLDETARVESIKALATQLIVSKYPLAKQLNMLARYSELNGRYVIFPYTAEAAEKAKLEEAYDWIKAVREESNRLEQDATATPNWPLAPMEEEG